MVCRLHDHHTTIYIISSVSLFDVSADMKKKQKGKKKNTKLEEEERTAEEEEELEKQKVRVESQRCQTCG